MSKLAERREEQKRRWRETQWPDIAIFLGPNAERFRAAWQKNCDAIAGSRAVLVWTWTWPAMLLGFTWFFYRRQWAVAGTLLLVPIVLGYLLRTSAGGSIGVTVMMAVMAKSLVVQDAVNRVARIKAAGGGRAELARAGGVSVVGGVVGGVLLAAELLSVYLTSATPG